MNRSRVPETREHAASTFFPAVQEAPGLVSFLLVQGEDEVSTAVILFESKAHTERSTG